ncbi:MAG: hypothetical protein WB493_03000, partial [Anaeromyxobacteraceae bacterium]
MNRRSTVLFAVVLAAVLTTACGGSAVEPQLGAQPVVDPPAGQTIVVVTAPTETDLQPGDSVRFAAQVTGTANTSVKWSVDEADGGTVDSSGVYTAPAAEGTFHVRAESVVATSGATGASVKGGGTSVVRVKRTATAQPVTVAVDPATVTVPAGGSVTFAAAVAGSTTRSVTWSVAEGASCGAVTPAGVYTAPSTGATCHVVATSQADTSKSASATVTVSAPVAPPPAVAVSISPATAALDACKGQVFTATVTNASNTAVTWTIVEAGAGTITNGAYVAPGSPGTYHVMAVSQADPTKTAQAVVTVGAEKVLSVALNPGSGTVQANGQLSFSA